MKQKDLITYGLIGLALVFILNQGKKDDDKNDEIENGGVYAGEKPNEGTPETPQL